MKTILVPTDFSENATKAINYAIKLAESNSSKIILFHACHLNYVSWDFATELVTEQNVFLVNKVEKDLENLCEKLRKKHDLSFEWINKQGLFLDILPDVIKKNHVDLVVMGTKGVTALEATFFGSNTAKAVRIVGCPVLVIPKKTTLKAIKKVVYATDYSTKNIDDIAKLVEFTRNSNAQIRVVHVAVGEDTQEIEEDQLNKFKNKLFKKITSSRIKFEILYGLDVDGILEQYIKRESIHLFSISTKHRSIMERLFGTKSIAKKMIFHSEIPLLVYHKKN
jgi:nucleotide-binding universal stress UspA family protein